MRSEATCCRNGCGRVCASELPACQFSFEPGDIVGQVMSFGSATPVEIAVLGSNLQDDQRFRAEDPGAACAAAVLAGSAIRAGAQLSDAGYQHQPRARRAVRLDDGRCGPVGGSGDFVVAIHAAELLARSELRQRVPDPGGAAAVADAEHRRAGRPSGDAERPLRAAADRRRDAEAGNHAGTDRTL